MKAGDVAVLLILVIGVGFIATLAMVMVDKIPTPDDPARNATVQNVSIPMAIVFGKGLSALDIGLAIVAVIGAMVVVYKVVWR